MEGSHTVRDHAEVVMTTVGGYEVGIATVFGPRILSLRRRRPGIASPLAELPGLRITDAGVAPFSFRGGHRLWVAPEYPPVTYAADDDPVAVTATDNATTVVGPIDAASWQKEITVTAESEAVLAVDHRVVNHGPVRRAAAWAITQLTVGGTAILPLGAQTVDPYGADRSIVAWPYTRWDDARITIRERHVEIDGTRDGPAKLGTALGRGWLAYRLGTTLFAKYTTPSAGPGADLGATGQVYANEHFVELETLGPLTDVPAGGSIEHRETWELLDIDDATSLGAVIELLDDRRSRTGERP